HGLVGEERVGQRRVHACTPHAVERRRADRRRRRKLRRRHVHGAAHAGGVVAAADRGQRQPESEYRRQLGHRSLLAYLCVLAQTRSSGLGPLLVSAVFGTATTSARMLPVMVAMPSGAAAVPFFWKSSTPGVVPSDCDLSSVRTAAELTGLPAPSSCGQP